jgi:hypothetical protein
LKPRQPPSKTLMQFLTGCCPSIPGTLACGGSWPLQDAIASLAQFPERCALAPESTVFPFEVRHLLYGHAPHVYRILFTIEDKTVYVLHIRHSRRQPLKHKS